MYMMFLSLVARKGNNVLQNLNLPQEVTHAIEEESKKIQIPHVEIRGVLDISVKKPDGIDIIKSILSSLETNKAGASVRVTYIGAPRYRIIVAAENFKIAEKTLNNTIEKVRSLTEKNHGIFNFIREESKKTHQQ